ncbi:MAG: putative peptidase [Saprospiraceae bacterium]|jgi:predicted peptidase
MPKSLLNISLFTLLLISVIGFSMFYSSCDSKALQMKNIQTGVYLKKAFKTQGGDLNYRIFFPENFDPSKEYPLLLFMHGSGERGNDNEAQLVHGSDLIAKGMNMHNAIAIFPQCPKADYWVKFKTDEDDNSGERSFDIDVESGPSDALGKVIALMNKMKVADYIDRKKIYVGGLSMGGMATFDLLWRMPNTFAAAMPICGAGSPEKAGYMKSVPMRIYHGEDDSVVPVDKSRKMQMAIESSGGIPEVFIYSGVNHNSWTNAFAEKDFLSWMFDKQLPAR